MQQRKSAIVFAVLSAMLGAGAAEDWKEKPAQDAPVAQLRGRALAAEEKARAEAAEASAEVKARADQIETQLQEGAPQNLTKLNVSANEVQAMAQLYWGGRPPCCDYYNNWSPSSGRCHDHTEGRYLPCYRDKPACCSDGLPYWSRQTSMCHTHWNPDHYDYC